MDNWLIAVLAISILALSIGESINTASVSRLQNEIDQENKLETLVIQSLNDKIKIQNSTIVDMQATIASLIEQHQK
jgi:hypothetical protein